MSDLFDELAARHGIGADSDATADSNHANRAPTRRTVLKSGLAASGLFWLGAGEQADAQPAPSGSAIGGGATIQNPAAFNAMAWLSVETDNTIRVMVAKSEMGQGVLTSLPMILADELDADWSKVRPEHAPLGRAFDDPRADARDTGGSRSIRMSYDLMRTLGASAREMFVTAAATRWGVAAAECEARDSHVHHAGSQRRATYAELAADAAKLKVPDKPTLKDPKDFKLIGKSIPRVDVPSKVDGSAVYAIDIMLPQMLVATIVQSPVFGGTLGAVDERESSKVRGYRGVVQGPDFVAVVATSFWQAVTAARALKVSWREGAFASMNQAGIREQFGKAADTPGVSVRNDGDAATALASAETRVDAEYEVPYLAQSPLEPMSCVAQVSDGRCRLWVGTQRHTQTVKKVAEALGLDGSRIEIQTTLLGGGFGRRFAEDFAVQAALVARSHPGRPVKLIWTREEDMQHSFYRPATYNRFSCALARDGTPVAWTHKIVCQAVLKAFRPELVKNGVDPTSIEGAANMPYAVPNVAVDYVLQDLPVPVGPWRSVGSSHNAFVTEGFIDELAHAAKRDPLDYRLGLLANRPRHRGVLQLAAASAGWGSPLPPGQGRGIAVAECFGGWCAQVAQVQRQPDGKVRIERIVVALDCGRVVNPRVVEDQMLSNVIYTLSAVRNGEITIDRGRVQQSNFNDFPALRINELPRIEVHIVPSDAAPGGVGEVGTPPLAPAVVNAIFAATGRRVRSLPLSKHELV
jgi:isoquinoline 1-oxidoreductase subunit beta